MATLGWIGLMPGHHQRKTITALASQPGSSSYLQELCWQYENIHSNKCHGAFGCTGWPSLARTAGVLAIWEWGFRRPMDGGSIVILGPLIYLKTFSFLAQLFRRKNWDIVIALSWSASLPSVCKNFTFSKISAITSFISFVTFLQQVI